MELDWTAEQFGNAQTIVMERFVQNSVAGHLTSETQVDDMETTVQRNRFDFGTAIVIDREIFGLYEPFSYCQLSKAQVDEFGTLQGNDLMQVKAATTFTRAASNLARWHDVLFFRGFQDGQQFFRHPSVQMPALQNPPQSLREAALEAEQQEGVGPIVVNAPFNERLVDAVYAAVVQLETRGYFNKYHLVLGETLWRALHQPTPGSMVLPRDRIKDTLMGGEFYRTTTLPPDEALLASLDGPTFDCVVAGDPTRQPKLEFLRVAPSPANEEFYLFRIRERFAPRVRENRAIVRLMQQ